MVLRASLFFIAVAVLMGCERIPEWELQGSKAKSIDLSQRLSQMRKWLFTCRGLRVKEIGVTADSGQNLHADDVEQFMDYFRSKNLSTIDSSGPKNFLGTAFLWDGGGTLFASIPASEGVRDLECRSATTPWLKAKILGVDHSIDYAVLKIQLPDGKDLGPNPWLDRTDELLLDENFSILGAMMPGHLDRTPVVLQAVAPNLSTGIDQSLMLFLPPPPEMMQGGVLVDSRLRVVGFLLPIQAQAWGAAISLTKAKDSVRAVLSGMGVHRPYVGFRMTIVPGEGFTVQQVQVGSPAYQAGLRPLDQVLEWNGKKLVFGTDWREVSPDDIGKSFRVKYRRGNSVTETSLKVASQE